MAARPWPATLGPRPAGAATAPGWRRGRAAVCACAPARAGYAYRPASFAQSPSTVTPALRPSFPRRSRDHGRSSREADQDQNRRGEAVRSRERRSCRRLLFLAPWRPEKPGGAQARAGSRTPGLTWGAAAGGDGAGTEGARRCPSHRTGALPSPRLPPVKPRRGAVKVAAAPPLRRPRSGRQRGGGPALEGGAGWGCISECAARVSLRNLAGGGRFQSITCAHVDARDRCEV